jgi:hypothetical protein
MQREHTRTVRDLVEVVAIVLAGAWALYVFVFQNVILPGLAEPTPTFAVTMRHVGNDGPFAVVRLEESIRNIGTVRVHFIGHSLTVLGMNVVPAEPGPALRRASAALYSYSRFTPSRVVYRDAIVTALGDDNEHRDLFVEPGQEITISREFYVPRQSFDRLEAWLVAAFTKNDQQTIPTTLSFRANGVPRFTWKVSGILSAMEALAQLDLKAE